jgi:hypothetical protein
MLYVCKLLWRPSSGWHLTADPSLFWRSRGLKQRTWSWQKSRPAFPEENRLGAIMIGQGVPEVKSHLPSALTGAWLETTHGDASPRTAMCGSTAVIGTTSATLLKIGGISKAEPRVHRGDS